MNMRVQNLIPWRRSDHPAPASVLRDDERSPFVSLHREMNRLFDDVFRSFDRSLPGTPWSSAAWPSVEIAETEREITLTAEVPGLEEKDIEVLLDQGVLTLKGERRSETSDKDRQFSERFYGRFERHVPLGAEIDENAIDAHFKDGVLTVVLPKTAKARAQVKRIPIKR